MKTSMKAGFVGLGVMGLAIARRLQAGGVKLHVWNRSREKCASLHSAGAVVCDTPADVASSVDTVFLCLMDGAAVEEVVFGKHGIAAAATGASLVVDHSSIGPDASRELARRLRARCGAGWLDAPVSGGVPAAERGELTVMLGGEQADFERALPLLQRYARNVTLMGSSGAGQVAKLCNQILVANALASISEALRLAAQGGIDAARLPEALRGGWADSALLQLFVPRMLELPEKSLGASTTMLKDLKNVQAFAAQHDVPIPLTAITEQLFRVLEFQSRGHLEPSAIFGVFERPIA